MYEIVINGTAYTLNFGMGFMRDMDSEVQETLPNSPGVKKKVGLSYAVAGLMDKELDTLENVLLKANKGCNPRLTQAILDEYIEDPDTDIEKVFDDVLGFLKSANATKITVKQLEERIAQRNQTE